jgi:enoyl-[acyl-carrier-protein] reductase (NADH)
MRARAALSLAAQGADRITGQTVFVDRGYLLT